jgi:cytochrome c oxidase subunit 3
VEQEPATERSVIDVSNFPRLTSGQDTPIWWGIIGLILIEMSVVSAFVVSALYLQMMNKQWPPQGTEVPDILLPTLSLIVLLGSCVTMYMASKVISKNKVGQFVLYTFASVILAVIVLAIRWQAFQNFEFRWDQHVYGSLVWTITGFHFVHVVSAAIGTAAIGLAGMAGFITRQRKIGVVVDTLYWNFVALAWIPFYIVLYWVPQLF